MVYKTPLSATTTAHRYECISLQKSVQRHWAGGMKKDKKPKEPSILRFFWHNRKRPSIIHRIKSQDPRTMELGQIGAKGGRGNGTT